jgi:dGTPase
LKYDHAIPETAEARTEKEKPEKGYYSCETQLVSDIKKNVADLESIENFKSLECQIMDIADDIAYSTYDLEDSLQSGFLSPLDIMTADEEILENVAKKVFDGVDSEDEVTKESVLSTLVEIFSSVSNIPDTKEIDLLTGSLYVYARSKALCRSGMVRTELTSYLVGKFIEGVIVEVDEKKPALSKIYLHDEIRKVVEVLKHFNYEATIMSPRLKVAEFRGHDIVHEIFEALVDVDKQNHLLLPDDFREIHRKLRDDKDKMRLISDFIAGMTDRYAVEFYSRLKSVTPQSIFKPL